MSFLRQTALLTQKDLLVIWRSKARFLAEMLVALLILPLILIIVSRATTEIADSKSFTRVPITGDAEDIERAVNSISRISLRYCLQNINLAYSSTPDIDRNVSNLMQELRLRYKSANQKVSVIPKQYPSPDAVREKVLQDLNATYSEACSRYFGGIHFTKLNPSSGELEYKLFMQNRQDSRWSLEEFWPEDGPYSSVADQNDIPGSPQYWQSGFLSIQFAINSIFLKWRNTSVDYDFYLQRMPTPKIRNSSVVAFLKQTPFFWMVMVMLVMMFTVKNIVAEKEAGIKTYMMVMGLNPYAFYASHFIVAFFKIFFVVSICSSLIAFTFENISASLFIAFSLTYGVAAVCFAIFISVVVRTSPGLIVVFAWLGLAAIDYILSPATTDVLFCFFASLNPYTAFKLGVKAATSYEMRLMDLGWFNMFDESSHSFSFGFAFLMLKIDIVILLLLICYLDAVVPNDGSPRRHPLFFLECVRKRGPTRRPCLVDDDETDGVVDENTETDSGMNRDEADIDIRKLVKIWDTTGQVAVDSLSLRAYRGQVTVLLGHNGAGKSTTFSVIAGSTSPSCGSVLICKDDIVDNLRDCQRNIGYCPQYNPLFDKLTAREHLRLYAKLKTDKDQRNVEEEVNAIAQDTALSANLDSLGAQLSGGMKRKLCVGMSLIGNSRVILLDEPTAGMDPGARHDIRILLERAKRNRTILLTTHYMDEADLLGDRIAIMVKGRIVCNGSPTFLKNKFGTGYVLSVVISTSPNPMDKIDSFDAKIDRILRVVRKHAHDARVDKTSYPQFSLVLPTQYKQYFASLFYELEQRKDELSIDSFGLSFNTLEQVFLRVGELADKNEDETDSGGEITGRAAAMRHEADSISVPALLARQLQALLYRHWLNALRNKWRTLLPVLLSVFIFTAFAASIKYQSRQKIERREFNLATMESVSVPLQLVGSGGGGTPGPDYPYIVNKMRAADRVHIPDNVDLNATLVRLAYRSPPLGIGAAVNTLAGNHSIVALLNGAAHHAAPLSLLLLSNAFIKDRPDSVKFTIELVNMPFADTAMATILAIASNMAVSVIVILAFSSLTSTFAMVLVEDRESRFKNQLLFTRLHIGIYWLAVTLWFLLFYCVFCLLIIGVFVIFGWLESCLSQTMLLWALYFWCCIPFVYCFSFLFDSPIKAFTAFLAWNVVVSLIALIAVAVLAFASPTLRDILTTIFYLFLPSFSLGDGMVRLAMQCSIASGAGGPPPGGSGRVEACMIASGAFFWILLAVLESKTIAVLIHRVQCRIRHRNYQTIEPTGELLEDEDVIRERRTVMERDDSEYALAVREVYKYYGNFGAVRNLTFGVKQTDCFGLLGVNGAGKTTTFNMLTGLSMPSSGRASISGVDVTAHPSLSYCPQFDALALDLTGRETLMILARLNGFKDAASRVENVLWCIHLTGQANKLVKYYSGGQRRRLSIGVTLISRSSLILLDEPTAGIDPKTRRYIWNLLTALRSQNVAMLLTSHSMDECEALCNNIGFMNKGTLVSIGTSQHLKSRYGNSFLLTYTVANPSKQVAQTLNAVVTREFMAEPTQDAETSTTLNWDVPRRSRDTWSDLYRRAQEIADRYPVAALPPTENIPRIKDFSLTQNSLEQVFLRLTRLSTGSDIV